MSTTMTPHAAPATTLPDAWRVEVFRRPEADDPEGAARLASLLEIGVERIAALRYGRGFLLPPTLTRAEVETAARELFVDPVLDAPRISVPRGLPAAPRSVQRILVARKPGVMDPVALTVAQALRSSGLVRG